MTDFKQLSMNKILKLISKKLKKLFLLLGKLIIVHFKKENNLIEK
jgi:hypothetical protein